MILDLKRIIRNRRFRRTVGEGKYARLCPPSREQKNNNIRRRSIDDDEDLPMEFYNNIIIYYNPTGHNIYIYE